MCIGSRAASHTCPPESLGLLVFWSLGLSVFCLCFPRPRPRPHGWGWGVRYVTHHTGLLVSRSFGLSVSCLCFPRPRPRPHGWGRGVRLVTHRFFLNCTTAGGGVFGSSPDLLFVHRDSWRIVYHQIVGADYIITKNKTKKWFVQLLGFYVMIFKSCL